MVYKCGLIGDYLVNALGLLHIKVWIVLMENEPIHNSGPRYRKLINIVILNTVVLLKMD